METAWTRLHPPDPRNRLVLARAVHRPGHFKQINDTLGHPRSDSFATSVHAKSTDLPSRGAGHISSPWRR